jgi:hypothetical protein
MYGWNDLKQRIEITDAKVECPVQGCENRVERRRDGQSLRDCRFLCRSHQIYITRSTFEYVEEEKNLLWCRDEDHELLRKIKRPGIKRECRLARDNSEDALRGYPESPGGGPELPEG